jgi:hypothetical protein
MYGQPPYDVLNRLDRRNPYGSEEEQQFSVSQGLGIMPDGGRDAMFGAQKSSAFLPTRKHRGRKDFLDMYDANGDGEVDIGTEIVLGGADGRTILGKALSTQADRDSLRQLAASRPLDEENPYGEDSYTAARAGGWLGY